MSWTVVHIFKDVARWHYFFSNRGICTDVIWTQWCAERYLRQNENDIAISSWWCRRQMDFFFCSFKKKYKNVPKMLQSKQACVINYSSRFQNPQEGRNSSSMHTRGETSCNPPVPRKQQNIFIHWEYHKKSRTAKKILNPFQVHVTKASSCNGFQSDGHGAYTHGSMHENIQMHIIMHTCNTRIFKCLFPVGLAHGRYHWEWVRHAFWGRKEGLETLPSDIVPAGLPKNKQRKWEYRSTQGTGSHLSP